EDRDRMSQLELRKTDPHYQHELVSASPTNCCRQGKCQKNQRLTHNSALHTKESTPGVFTSQEGKVATSRRKTLPRPLAKIGQLRLLLRHLRQHNGIGLAIPTVCIGLRDRDRSLDFRFF